MRAHAMNRVPDRAKGETQPLWRYVPLGDHHLPPEAVQDTARHWTVQFWSRLRGKEESSGSVDELEALPPEASERIAPSPDWRDAARALDGALAESNGVISTAPARPAVVVGPPYSGTTQVLVLWAEARGWTVKTGPSPKEVLAGGERWFEGLASGPLEPFVLPRLERCFLRHHHGLSLMRGLVDWLLASERACLIGCDSWAWAYLSTALGIDRLAPVLTLEAFDGERLARWFAQLSPGFDQGGLEFRERKSGRPILRSAVSDGALGSENAPGAPRREQGELSDFLERLAARSRGIPGVALAIWRHALRLGPDREQAGPNRSAEASLGRRTVWVEPWAELELPEIPGSVCRSDILVLHALLLHNGLESERLRDLVPVYGPDVFEVLRRLEAARLVASIDGRWRVTALGYPAVRRCLASEGYLVDSL